MNVRPATGADADAVLALEQQGFGDHAWPLAVVGEGVAGLLPTVQYWVATDADPADDDDTAAVVAGYAVVSTVAEIADLQRLAVDDRWRRRGVATALVEQVALASSGAGADRLLLEVRADNRGARSFYEALGFVEIDRRRRYYRDGETAVVMRRDLVASGGAGVGTS